MILCATVLIFRDGKLLATTRRGTTDQWGLPGGKSDAGEDPRDTAIREALEETGVAVTLSDFPPFIREDEEVDGVFRCFCYLASTDDTPRQMEEGIRADFVEVADLLRGPFGHYNKRALQHFQPYSVDAAAALAQIKD